VQHMTIHAGRWYVSVSKHRLGVRFGIVSFHTVDDYVKKSFTNDRFCLRTVIAEEAVNDITIV
jgi:hypothetical protein